MANVDQLERALPEPARAWLRGVALDDKLALLAAFSGATRAVGKAPLAVAGRGAWGTDEVARAVLVVRGRALVSPRELWAHGDNRERRAVLLALPLLADAEQHVELAVEACRANVIPVFEAIACENPFPARYFSELQFNQMALKAAFNGVALARIVGLAERRNAELARMANDFAAERRAAGRAVPADLGLLLEGTP
jgi:hypothetical protein